MPKPPTPTPELIEATDEHLVELATSGDSAALTELLGRQQTWIYNLAFYMLHARAFVRDGIVDPANIRFARGHLEGIHLQAAQRGRELAALLGDTQQALRRLYPLFAAPEVSERLSALLNSNELRAVLNLN